MNSDSSSLESPFTGPNDPRNATGNTSVELEPTAGSHIEKVCKDAVALARKRKRPVTFNFNERIVTVDPKDTLLKVLKKWDSAYNRRHSAVYPDTAKEALRRWDAGECVWTVEMGGLGPGYEQAIQITVFDILRRHLTSKKPLPKAGTPMNGWMDKACHGRGLSGAQAGAAKNLAYRYLRDGYEGAIKSLPEADRKDRLILVSKAWPSPQSTPNHNPNE